VQGRKAPEYVDISRFPDAAMGHFGQIPAGRLNGFHLEAKSLWKGNQPSRQEFPSDLFAILTLRRRGL
jgi:hypothetical protein